MQISSVCSGAGSDFHRTKDGNHRCSFVDRWEGHILTTSVKCNLSVAEWATVFSVRHRRGVLVLMILFAANFISHILLDVQYS
jgi:hypothetical protein